MLTMRQYLNQFVRKDHTVELRRLMAEIGCTREQIYKMAGGKPISLEYALRAYVATGYRVDPRPMASNVNWGVLDAYYSRERGTPAPQSKKPVAAAGKPRVAKQAGNRVQPGGRAQGSRGAGKSPRKGASKT